MRLGVATIRLRCADCLQSKPLAEGRAAAGFGLVVGRQSLKGWAMGWPVLSHPMLVLTMTHSYHWESRKSWQVWSPESRVFFKCHVPRFLLAGSTLKPSRWGTMIIYEVGILIQQKKYNQPSWSTGNPQNLGYFSNRFWFHWSYSWGSSSGCKRIYTHSHYIPLKSYPIPLSHHFSWLDLHIPSYSHHVPITFPSHSHHIPIIFSLCVCIYIFP